MERFRPATSPNKRRRRRTATSPEAFRSSRQAAVVDDARPATMGSPIGRHSDQRTQRRAERQAFTNVEDDIVSSLMQEFNSQTARRAPVAVKDSDDGKYEYRFGERMNVPSSKIVQITERTPNATVGTEMFTTSGISALGTSQLNGCQGDFCSTDITKFETLDVDFEAVLDDRIDGMCEFRRNIMLKEQEEIKRRALGIPTGNDHSQINLLSQTRVMVGQPNRQIAQRTIIQARQEMPLVKLAIDRHRRGEEGDYVGEDSFSDLATTGKLPAVYYKDVPCCDNCFKIYSLIDIERTKALKKVRREAKDKENGTYWAKKRAREIRAKTASNDKENSGPNSHRAFSASSSSSSHSGGGLGMGSVNSSRTFGGNTHASSLVNATNYKSIDSNSEEVTSALQNVLKLVDGLTKLDIAEIRTMTKPPAAVEIILEAVMILLTGKVMSFQEIRKLMGSGESFILMLREFRISDVSDERMQMIGPYVDNPVFQPENVVAVSLCASKFCGWVQGIVQAARWQRGMYNKHANLVGATTTGGMKSRGGDTVDQGSDKFDPNQSIGSIGNRSLTTAESTENLTFMQKLERRKASRLEERKSKSAHHRDITRGGEHSVLKNSSNIRKPNGNGSQSKTDSLNDSASKASYYSQAPSSISPPKMSQREIKAMASQQAKAANRMADKNGGGNLSAVGDPRTFRCADGITRMPYLALGSIVPTGLVRNNFVVIHDFFDTCSATAIFFKPLVQRHDGSQVFTFNYPGQSDTTWPRLRPVEMKNGATDPIMNNDWIADRIHELLQYAEENGDFLLNRPFHLVGIGNGVPIAASFLQKWGGNALYKQSIKSLVSINGFLAPDPQLTSILHSASQIFESSPHGRPDIPVSYWARFVFSEDYLQRINPNLALNIMTAVSNPITNEGRMKLTKGCIQHKDLRSMLSPENLSKHGAPTVPLIILQSTENQLINASNVDAFLVNRKAKHLWSHQQNVITEQMVFNSADPQAGWVKMSRGPDTYSKYSSLGKTGLKMLSDSLEDERAVFVMWARAGHHLMQENKAAILDLFDALCHTNMAYFGLDEAPQLDRFGKVVENVESKEVAKMEIMFKIKPPKKTVEKGFIEPSDENGEIRIETRNKTCNETRSDHASVVLITEPAGTSSDSNADASSSPNPNPTINDTSGDQDQEGNANLAMITVTSKEIEMNDTIEEREKYGSDNGCGDASEEQQIDTEEFKEREIEDEDIEKEKKKSELESNALEIDTACALVGDPIANGANASQDEGKGDVPSREPVLASISLKPYPSLPAYKSAHSVSSSSSRLAIPDASASPLIEEEIDRQSELRQDENSNTHDVLFSPTTINTTLDSAVQGNLTPKHISYVNSSESTPHSIPTSPVDGSLREISGPLVPADPTPPVVPSSSSSSSFSSSHTLQKHVETTTPVYMANPISIQPLASTKEQRSSRKWSENVPDSTTAIELMSQLDSKHAEFIETKAKNTSLSIDEQARLKIERIKREQEERIKKYQEEDQMLLNQLERELEKRRRERVATERQRKLELQEGLEGLEISELVPDYEQNVEGMDQTTTLREMPPLAYDAPIDLPQFITQLTDPVSRMDQMLEDEENMKKMGGNMSVEEYEAVKSKMATRQMERDEKLRHLSGEEQTAMMIESTIEIQRVGRGYMGRKRAMILNEERELSRKVSRGVLMAQKYIRGATGRKRYRELRKIHMLQMVKGQSALNIQRCFRGHVARKMVKKRRQFVRCRDVQRVYRGHMGRKGANREKTRMRLLQSKINAANKIVSLWRMKIAREEYRSLRVHVVASNEIQRVYRGHIGRKMVQRRREWNNTQPGPERIKLGLKLIEESKRAFEQQEEEIQALHRAQEKAEGRVSHIHKELKENEKELLVLERELAEIDSIERDLSQMTHERDLLQAGITDATGMPRLAMDGHEEMVNGRQPTMKNDPDLERKKRAEAYALEMTIQIKRAEREKKRQELEAEFAVVFAEVKKKKSAIARLEVALNDMEATRERKDREFRRLQQNLMQLLLEQKTELDELREKGIQLETATATTAAAAAATAMKAKEHDDRSKVVFSQTEELMKFQFMSMSLSYFSSLNMLKSLRDMNADTTSAAVAATADAAAASAAAASAANMPSMKKLELGANDFVEMSIQKKKAELAMHQDAEQKAKKAKGVTLPSTVKLWTVSNVATWLETLCLEQYVPQFREATVDGAFLMELREEDIVQILGVKHKLHVRKLLTQREKLKPLSVEESAKMKAIEGEEDAEAMRRNEGIDPESVFSQVRNGRTKRVEESLNAGFPVDAEDGEGNSLLLLACQQVNKRIVEMLLIRGANVNHQNSQGNTALHFALAFDTAGMLGEYLIEQGADDSIENLQGLSPYDGVSK